MRKALLTIGLLLSIQAVLGVNQVILVTDKNTPDLYSATAVGSHEGIPVLVLHNGEIDDNITSIITKSNATEVILAGGTRAISSSVETELESMGYNVTRLWGISQTETAVEIARYFYSKANCTVLAEDNDNPENDSLIQEQALSKASVDACPLIPVPSGKIPANVLELLKELHVSNVSYVAREKNDSVRDALISFNLTEVTGNITEIRDHVLEHLMNKTEDAEMTIVASHGWNGTLGIGAQLNNNTFIRRVNNISQMPDVLADIKMGNFSEIKVVGEPSLATQIVNYLQANNITAIEFEGEYYGYQDDLWNNSSLKFHEREMERELELENETSDRLDHVRNLMNDSLSEVSLMEVEIEDLRSQGVDVTHLEDSLNMTREMLNMSRDSIENEDVGDAQRLMTMAVSMLRQDLSGESRWDWRKSLQIEVSNNYDLARSIQITSVENNLTHYNVSCGKADEIKSLIDKAKQLRDLAANETDPGSQAELLQQAKENADHAENLGNICVDTGSIPQELTNAVTEDIARTNERELEIEVHSQDHVSTETQSSSDSTVTEQQKPESNY